MNEYEHIQFGKNKMWNWAFVDALLVVFWVVHQVSTNELGLHSLSTICPPPRFVGKNRYFCQAHNLKFAGPNIAPAMNIEIFLQNLQQGALFALCDGEFNDRGNRQMGKRTHVSLKKGSSNNSAEWLEKLAGIWGSLFSACSDWPSVWPCFVWKSLAPLIFTDPLALCNFMEVTCDGH